MIQFTVIKYTIPVSAVLLVILVIQQSPYLWPGTFFFLSQIILLFLIKWLINIMRKKERPLLIPVMKQYLVFFSVMFPLWIGLTVTGHIVETMGRIFSGLFFGGFFVLGLTLIKRLLAGGDLLDRFSERDDDKQKKNGKEG